MMKSNSYQSAAQNYADAVNVLFAPSRLPSGERGKGPANYENLAERAEQLSFLSDQFTQAAKEQVMNADHAVRIQASIGLMAKAITDLEITGYLLQAAEDENEKLSWRDDVQGDRSIAGSTERERTLNLLLGKADVGLLGRERAKPPSDIPNARFELLMIIEDTLDLILQRASKTGQVAFAGLVGLGATEVAQAAKVVGMDIAQMLGQVEKVTRLYELVRAFAVKIYNTLIALLGQPIIQTVTSHVLGWYDEVNEGKYFGGLMEKIYDTKLTYQELEQYVKASQSPLPQYVVAIEAVNQLDSTYLQQTRLAEKLLNGLKFLSGVPVSVIPLGKVLLAASYIILGGYIILVGADYVDSQRLRILNRVLGVREVVKNNLINA